MTEVKDVVDVVAVDIGVVVTEPGEDINAAHTELIPAN